MYLDGGGNDPVLQVDNGATLTVSGALSINAVEMRVVASDIEIGNGLSVSGDLGLTILADAQVLVYNDLSVTSSGIVEVISGNLTVQSIQEEDGTYTGGNMNVSADAYVVVYNDGQISVLGNKNFGVGIDDPLVEGDLTIDGSSEVEVQPFGIVLIYHDVTTDESSNFFTSWVPEEGELVPYFVRMGGTSCDEWTGPLGTCIDNNSTLPVELLSLVAKEKNGSVQVLWKTAAEIDNHYFAVERSVDAMNFDIIGMVDGNGTIEGEIEYQYIDNSPMPGVVYYRLVQTDFDGTSEVFGPISVVVGFGSQSMVVYPNPLSAGSLKLQVLGLKENRAALLQVMDLSGRTILTEDIYIERAGGEVIELDIASRLKKGVYVINLNQDQSTFTQRLVKL
jgi:hypothetical protein